MKTIVLLFILVFATPQLLAADVFENFNNGINRFGADEWFSASNQRFVFKGNRSDNTTIFKVWHGGSNPGGWTAKPEHSNYFTYFNASVDAIWLDGANNHPYGIRICSTENNFGHPDYVRFVINKNSSFMIDATIDANKKKLQEWTQSSLITENQSNNLSITKSGNEYRFYINHTEVKKLVIEGCAGGAIGIEASNSLEAAFDNFKIKDLSIKEVSSNKPPKAFFTTSPRQGNAPFTVSLNASTSFDPDGSITGYQWSSSNGQTANGKNSQLTFNNPGTYTITLIVTDDKGAATSTGKTIKVTEPKNQDPKASFTMSSQTNIVSLNASSSFDPDGHITAYQWSSSNGQAASGQNAQLTFPNPGTYAIILTVTDDKGATNSTQKSITFNQQNQPPQTNPTTTPTTNNENVAALKFIDYKPIYQVGDMLMLNLQVKITKNRNQRVDLWVSLQLPNGGILYMTPKITQLFSAKAQPFIKSVERIDESYRILQLQVPEGIGGNYTLSAIFIKEGKNFITGGPTVIKSNIALVEIVLSNR